MAQPPSFYGGQVPQVGRLPTPIDTGAPLVAGLDKVSSAVADAVQSSRDTALEVRRIQRERALQLQTGSIAAGLADLHGQLQTDVIGLRDQSAPGAVGHADAVNARLDKFHDDASALIGQDPELVARFADNVATMAANVRTGEAEWTAKQSATQSLTNIDTLQNSLSSNIRTAIAAGTANDQMLTDADALDARAIDALPIPGTAKATLKQDRSDERLATVVDARTNVDPHAVVADIDAGKYSALDDKVLKVLRNHAEVKANELDNKAREAANASLGVQRAQARNLIEDVKGGTIVDAKQLASYRAIAAASSKPEDISLVHDLDVAAAQLAVNARYGNSTIDERNAAVQSIETKKGWQTNNDLRVAHDQLQTLIQRDRSAAEADPLTLYQRQTGQSIGALNLADAHVMQQRFLAGDQAAQRFHTPIAMHFTEDEAKQLREQYNQASVGGKADFIQTLGAYGTQRAREMINQIAPGKPELIRMAELAASPDPAVQSIVREAADGSAAPMKPGTYGALRNLAQSEDGAALSRLPGDRQKAILDVATWIYAHRANAAGKADAFNPDLARESVNAALGSTGVGKGGLGTRNGAPVVLPMGATQADFDTILAVATPEEVRSAANGVPKWSNRDLTLGEFRNDTVPVLINDTGSQALYAFRSKGGAGYVKNERGQDYVVDLRKLADVRRAERLGR